MAKKEGKQTTFIWWDGKQKLLSDFYKELGIEQLTAHKEPSTKNRVE